MPVQPSALVSVGDIRQAMGCLDAEFLEDLHVAAGSLCFGVRDPEQGAAGPTREFGSP
jgi:hypothetical protein